MGIYTNEGLVKHAEKAYRLPTKYMWGGILRPIEKQYDMLFSMYGNNPGIGYTAERWNELRQLRGKGYYGVDCVGLVKSYYWSGNAEGGTGSPKYGASGFPDVNAGTMYNAAKIKGKISTMPDRPGIVLYSKTHPHVGIYVGNDLTIESTLGSRGDGVVKRRFDKFWEYWFECPFISYTSYTNEKTPAIAVGDKVIIKDSAFTYAGTTIKIPTRYKGKDHVYTVSKVSGEKVLIEELYSWVWGKDLEKK